MPQLKERNPKPLMPLGLAFFDAGICEHVVSCVYIWFEKVGELLDNDVLHCYSEAFEEFMIT